MTQGTTHLHITTVGEHTLNCPAADAGGLSCGDLSDSKRRRGIYNNRLPEEDHEVIVGMRDASITSITSFKLQLKWSVSMLMRNAVRNGDLVGTESEGDPERLSL